MSTWHKPLDSEMREPEVLSIAPSGFCVSLLLPPGSSPLAFFVQWWTMTWKCKLNKLFPPTCFLSWHFITAVDTLFRSGKLFHHHSGGNVWRRQTFNLLVDRTMVWVGDWERYRKQGFPSDFLFQSGPHLLQTKHSTHKLFVGAPYIQTITPFYYG